MPVYEFTDNKGNFVSIFRNMKDNIPKQIKISKSLVCLIFEDTIEKQKKTKEFKKNKIGTYDRVFSVPYAIMDAKKPKTIGSLAAKNTEKMIKEGNLKPKKKQNPWWRANKNKVDKDLAKLSKRQREKYIMTGKK